MYGLKLNIRKIINLNLEIYRILNSHVQYFNFAIKVANLYYKYRHK